MRIFGIDPGSRRTGYGCIETDGTRCRLVLCGAVVSPASVSFPDKLTGIFDELIVRLESCRPSVVAVEEVFNARNAKSALKLGQARGVALLAAAKTGLPVAEYTATAVKRAVVGYGRADKEQVQRMVTLLLGLEKAPSPHDVSDALAIAICHAYAGSLAEAAGRASGSKTSVKSWRRFRPSV